MKEYLDLLFAPIMAIVGWQVSDRQKTQTKISTLETNSAVAFTKLEAMSKTLDKIDSRQEELIDYLLRSKNGPS